MIEQDLELYAHTMSGIDLLILIVVFNLALLRDLMLLNLKVIQSLLIKKVLKMKQIITDICLNAKNFAGIQSW